MNLLKQIVDVVKSDLTEVERWKYPDETANLQRKKFCEEMRKRLDALVAVTNIYDVPIDKEFGEALLKQSVKSSVLSAKIVPQTTSLIDILLGDGTTPTGGKNVNNLRGLLTMQAYEDVKTQLIREAKSELKKVAEK